MANRLNRGVILLSFLLVLGLAKSYPTYALADPDIIAIESVTRYTNVVISGDALIIVHYDLEYTVPPAESILEGWIGRVMDVGGAGQLASVSPQAHHLIPLEGYDHGVYSFYFSVAPVPTGALTITLEGNPGVVPTPTGVVTTSIVDKAASELVADMRLLALHLEDQWNKDVIIFGSGVGRLSDGGANYFLAAIPNLVTYAPSLFSLGFIQPDPSAHIDPVDTTFQTGRDAVWAGTPLRGLMNSISGGIGMSRTAFETALVLVVALVIGGSLYAMTKTQEVAIFGSIVWINVAVYGLFGVLALAFTFATIAILALAYWIFWQPSTT